MPPTQLGLGLGLMASVRQNLVAYPSVENLNGMNRDEVFRSSISPADQITSSLAVPSTPDGVSSLGQSVSRCNRSDLNTGLDTGLGGVEDRHLVETCPVQQKRLRSNQADFTPSKRRVGSATHYNVRPILSPKDKLQVQNLRNLIARSSSQHYRVEPRYLFQTQIHGMQEVWRQKTSKWFRQIGDSLGLPNEIAYFAVDFLDRFLSTHSVGPMGYKLVAAGCWLIASKQASVQQLVSPATLVKMAGYGFAVKDLVTIEKSLLFTFKWHLNPATSLELAAHFLSVVQQQQAGHGHDLIIKSTVLQCLQLTLDEYSMVRFSSLEQAWAAIRCSLLIHKLPNVYRVWRTLIEQISATSIPGEFTGTQPSVKTQAEETACFTQMSEICAKMMHDDSK